MVSEVMLQQTQVPRVIPKFEAWMERFPDIGSLAAATADEVLVLWSGLGYNRRAMALQRSCRILAGDFGGRVPADEVALRSLPGIGVYTSRAILAFAFDETYGFLETKYGRFCLAFLSGEEVSPQELAGRRADVSTGFAPGWYGASWIMGRDKKDRGIIPSGEPPTKSRRLSRHPSGAYGAPC